MDAKLLSSKVVTTVTDVLTLLDAADKVNARARTVYYKSAFILMASVLEVGLYAYVDVQCRQNPKLLKNASWKFVPIQKLDEKIQLHTNELYIAERTKTKEPLDNVRRDFNSMISFCKEQNLLSKYFCTQLRWAKDKRNEVHLQKTPTHKRSYNRKMVLRVSKLGLRIMKEYQKALKQPQP